MQTAMTLHTQPDGSAILTVTRGKLICSAIVTPESLPFDEADLGKENPEPPLSHQETGSCGRIILPHTTGPSAVGHNHEGHAP
jgi:hypothetical protein